jgi:hypothetical protein
VRELKTERREKDVLIDRLRMRQRTIERQTSRLTERQRELKKREKRKRCKIERLRMRKRTIE